MPSGSVTADTRLVLASAIYFKGRWAARFDPARTRIAAFRTAGGEEAQVPMMSRSDTLRFAARGGAMLLELPYLGRDLSMILLLPERPDGLPELEARMSAAALEEWLAEARVARIEVSLPRFRFASSFTLPEALRAMGMPSAFDPQAADFSGIDGARDLFISAAVHKAFVEVNEEGTEAAAATGISVGTTSMPPEFRADHPFLFLIRDRITGCVLFLGRVADPRVS